MTALRAEGCGLPFGRRLKKGARLRRRLCRRVVFASLRGATAALPPRVADCRSAAILIKSALRDWLSVSYGMISILRIGSLRSPPFGGYTTTFPPQAGALQPVLNLGSLMKKLPHGALFCHRLRGKSREAGKGDAFLSSARAVVGFIQTGAFYKLEAPTTPL